MEQKMEDKILGKKPESQPAPKAVKNNLGIESSWEVSCEGCGKSIMSGIIVAEMLDLTAKKKAKAGETEFKSGKFNFKLMK